MNTVRNNGISVSGRVLGTACFAAILPQLLLSEALKDKAGTVSVARTVVLLDKQNRQLRRG
jgi:hypothetical protein